MLGQLTAELT